MLRNKSEWKLLFEGPKLGHTYILINGCVPHKYTFLCLNWHEQNYCRSRTRNIFSLYYKPINNYYSANNYNPSKHKFVHYAWIVSNEPPSWKSLNFRCLRSHSPVSKSFTNSPFGSFGLPSFSSHDTKPYRHIVISPHRHNLHNSLTHIY